MNSQPTLILNEKYNAIVKSENWSSGPGGVSAGPAESPNEEPEVALDWTNTGLFEPETDEENKLVQVALNELSSILEKFSADLEDWQHKNARLGSLDTVSREQVAQHIAKAVLHITSLD